MRRKLFLTKNQKVLARLIKPVTLQIQAFHSYAVGFIKNQQDNAKKARSSQSFISHIRGAHKILQ